MKWRNRVAILSRKPKFGNDAFDQHQFSPESSLEAREKANNSSFKLTPEQTVIGPGNQRYFVFVRNSPDTFTCLGPDSSMPKPLSDVVDNMLKSISEHQTGKNNLRKSGSAVRQNIVGLCERNSVPNNNGTVCESIEVYPVECPEKDNMIDEATIHICDTQSDYSDKYSSKCHISSSQYYDDSVGAWNEQLKGINAQADESKDEAFQYTYGKVKGGGKLKHIKSSDKKSHGRLPGPRKSRSALLHGKTMARSYEDIGHLDHEVEVLLASETSNIENACIDLKLDADIRKSSGEDVLEQSFEMQYMLFQDENQNSVFERADKICEERVKSLHQGGETRSYRAVGAHPETQYVHDIRQLMHSDSTIDGLSQDIVEMEVLQHILNKESTKEICEETSYLIQDNPYDFSESPQLVNDIGLPSDFSLPVWI